MVDRNQRISLANCQWQRGLWSKGWFTARCLECAGFRKQVGFNRCFLWNSSIHDEIFCCCSACFALLFFCCCFFFFSSFFLFLLSGAQWIQHMKMFCESLFSEEPIRCCVWVFAAILWKTLWMCRLCVCVCVSIKYFACIHVCVCVCALKVHKKGVPYGKSILWLNPFSQIILI